MASGKMETAQLLAAFYDGGVATPLFGTGGAVSAACGLVGGVPVYTVCQNGDAVSAQDIKLTRKTLKLAAKTGNPVVTFYDSKGVNIEEGLSSLKAVRKLNAATAVLSGVVPQIAVVTGVCGASSAMAAASADLLVMTEDAQLFLSSPFLSAAAGDKVEGAGSAAFAKEAGIASLVVKDAEEAAKEAAKLVMLLPGNNLSAPASFEFGAPSAALSMAKYSGADATAALADDGSAVELYNGFGSGVVTSLATINGSVVGIVATNGADTYLGPRCVSRAARFVRLCDAFSIPVVTVLNTGGMEVSVSKDAAGNIRDAARLAATYADATTAKVAVIAGKAVGTAYTALGDADLTIMLKGAVLAPVEPTAAVSVLYKEEIEAAAGSIEAETAARAKAYEAEVAGADAVLAAGLADFVADEAGLRTTLAGALDILSTKRTQRLPKKHGNMAL